MARPVLPAANETGWATKLNDAINVVSDRADTALSTASGQSATPGGVLLDSFAGGSDDAKLTAALSYAAAQTVKPHIWFGNRRYDFTTPNRNVFSGLKLSGLGGHGNQQRAANSIPNDIRYTGGGTWWVNSGTTFDVYMGGLCFQGNSASQFMSSNPGVLWTSVFRDLGFNLWKNVFGNPGTKFLNTAILFDGWWNINNGYGTAITLGGSDSNFWMGSTCLIDSGIGGLPASDYHLRFDSQQKSNIGAIYMTNETRSGIYINGGTALNFWGPRAEGRNAGQPCVGSNIRIDGGAGNFFGAWVSYGATNLNSQGHTGEGGVITQTGGDWLYDGCWYARATGVAETVPFIYCSGGKARVRNIRASGTWSGLPRVDAAGGTVDADNSVTLI